MVEVNFTEITEDKNMRHPVFVNLRPDKDVIEAIAEKKKNLTINKSEASSTKKKVNKILLLIQAKLLLPNLIKFCGRLKVTPKET